MTSPPNGGTDPPNGGTERDPHSIGLPEVTDDDLAMAIIGQRCPEVAGMVVPASMIDAAMNVVDTLVDRYVALQQTVETLTEARKVAEPKPDGAPRKPPHAGFTGWPGAA